MPFTKVDDKGRVVLPNDLRRRLGINPGDEFAVDELGPNAIVLKNCCRKTWKHEEHGAILEAPGRLMGAGC